MSKARYTGILDGNAGDVRNIRDLAAIRASGVSTWIAKATEGGGDGPEGPEHEWIDKAFATFVPHARAAGFEVGAYHYLRGKHSGANEADHFLNITRPHRAVAPMLLALDWESGDAPADHARDFVQRIHDVTGVWPLVYAGEPYLRSKIGRVADPILAKCPWWYPAYGVDPDKPHLHATWGRYDLMQYTNGGAGPSDTRNYVRKTPGIGGCDRSCFNGTEVEYRAWRALHVIGLGPSERP